MTAPPPPHPSPPSPPSPSLEQARRLRAQGKPAEALAVLAGLPESPDILLERAGIQHSASMFDDAASTLQRLLAISPDHPPALRLLGRVHLSTGRYAHADAAFMRLLERNPDDPIAIAGRAEALRRDVGNGGPGDQEAALAILEPHLSTAHDAIATAFAHLARRAGRVDEALALLDRALLTPNIPADRRADALHAQAELLDAAGRRDEAFASFCRSNELRATPFDADAQERLFDRIRAVYQPGSHRVLPNSGLDLDAPVFIVGMPRSGTSLAEQIIASHPGVGARGAGGERPDIRNIIMSFPRRTAPPTPFPDGARVIPAQTLKQLAGAYAAPHLKPGVQRITDKTPMNFMAIGLIAQLFPRARIVHCVRHPLDTCLSCYFSNFAGAHPYTRDLGALARFYAQYRRMMDHWAKASPLPILDLEYESLVADQEAQSRALISFVGLAWDDACLDFHKTARPVATASFDQVRRPMYASSVARWKRYRAHLKPLIDTLLAEGVDPGID